MKKLSVPKVKLTNTWNKFLGIFLIVLISSSAGFVGGWAGSRNQLSGSGGMETQRQIISSESQLTNQIAKTVGESVVSINVSSQTTATDFFGFDRTFESQAAGTGVIISEDGVVVTNRHVLGTATDGVTVTLSDGTELTEVEIIGRTNENDPLDIAFLRIKDKKGKDLKAATLGDSGIVQVGDKVIAIGNALGEFQNTVTAGIISGFGRNIMAGDRVRSESLQNLLQTDAAINQGNSGGPLVSVNGEVIGINTAVAGGSAENIGFAIPINDIKGLIKSVLEKGKLERPYLGVRYVPLNQDAAEAFDLEQTSGAYIVPRGNRRQPSVIENSPAAKAGLREGDIITKIAGKEISDTSSLTSLISQHPVGETIDVTIIRDGNEQTLKVTLEAAPTN